MGNTTCPTISPSMFFKNDEMYYEATLYSITFNVSFAEAQIAIYGQVYFEG